MIISALACLLPGCGGSSTQSGEPPSIDAQQIQIMVSGANAVVSAGPGAVSPGGAEIEVTNVTTGESQTGTAAPDGSFEVTLPGSAEDEYEVEVTSSGQTASATIAPDSPDPSDELTSGLVGRTFLLESSDGFTPLPGTTVRLNFGENEFGFSAGCNSHGGPYNVCDAHLCSEGLGSTQIGCDAERHAQDEWLAEFFTSTPALELVGDTLTVTGTDATLTFLDQEVADPDRPLTGRIWTVDTFIENDAFSSVPLERVPTLEFGLDGKLRFFTSCNNGEAEYEVDGQQIVFSEYSVTEAGCPNGAASNAEATILGLVSPGVTTFEIDTRRLTLMRDGVGVSATTE